MNLTLRQLHIFSVIARTGSTTAAAQAIPLSQSATSAALNELETQWGTRLFDRVGKRLQLNEVGRSLLPEALQLLDGASQLEQRFSTGQNTPASLQVAASSTIGNYILPKLLAEFQQLAPEVQVSVVISNTADVVQRVADYSTDIGLIEGSCSEPGLLVEPWLDDHLVVIAAATSPLARKRRVSRDQLREAHWLLREDGSGTREEVNHALLPHLHYLPSSLVLGSSEAIKHGVAAGLGISCLSRWVVAEQLASGVLVELKTDLPPLHRRFYRLRQRDKFVSAGLQRFWEHCAMTVPAA